MSECFYDTDEGEFVDFATLEDWEIQDKKKDARIKELEEKYRLVAGDKIDLRSELASAQGRIKELDNHCRDLEAKLAEEIRISNKRGNVIEFDLLPKLHDTEAKLAKAVVAIEEAHQAMLDSCDSDAFLILKNTLEELKGQTNEPT